MVKTIKIILILFVIASIGYLVAKEYAGPFIKHSSEPAQNEAQTTDHPDGIVLYYFHGNRRCPTCTAIERYSHEAVIPYLNENKLTWQTVNVEGSGKKHFIYDFNLSSPGPVVVEYEDGKVKRWQALDRVWKLIRDKEAFAKYIDDEVKRFIQ